MNTDTFFRIAILVLIVVALGISAYFRRRAARRGNDKIERREEGLAIMILLRIAGFGLWLAMLVYVVNPEWIAFAAVPLPVELRWVGLFLSVTALPLMVWMFRSLGDNITDTVIIRQKAQLVTRGPYRWIRHPLYSFGSLFFGGMLLMTSNLLIAVLGITALAMLWRRTPKEEARLVERFGEEYRAYMERTGRFIPRVRA